MENVFLTILLLAYPVYSVVVDTQHGRVRGHSVELDNGREQTKVDVFYGIPFAKDTSGPRRFRKPELPDPWAGIFEADTIGDACPQSGGLVWITHPEWDKFSEDCLNLNIYTPNVHGGPYPVMLWIYGGAFTGGANVNYAGHFLASRDVVVVVVNYRIGKFGFAYTANDACPGNAGLWDQKMGLEFVINNIANFGGDPNKITIFGESAGAISASMMMLSPETKDLFQQAIMQSGAERNGAVALPDWNIEEGTYTMAEDLDCLRSDDYEMMDCLREHTWQNIFDNSSGSTMPTVDGPGGFIPLPPKELRANGDIMTGPIMSGINKDDAAYFLAGIVPEVLFGCCNRTYYQHVLRTRFVGIFESLLTNQSYEDVFRALDFNYSPWPYVYDRDRNRASLVQLLTNVMFTLGWDTQLKDHWDIAPTYGFVFNYREDESPLPAWMGVPHIVEIPYVFGFPLLDRNPAVRNDSLIFGLDWFNDDDVEYSIFIQELWTNFAKYGNPTPSPVNNPLGGTTTWSQFTWDDMRILLFGNESITNEKEWDQINVAFWQEYMPYVSKVEDLSRFTDLQQEVGGILYEFLSEIIDELVGDDNIAFFKELGMEDIW